MPAQFPAGLERASRPTLFLSLSPIFSPALRQVVRRGVGYTRIKFTFPEIAPSRARQTFVR